MKVIKRILVDGGYSESGNYYFYINDHLGYIKYKMVKLSLNNFI